MKNICVVIVTYNRLNELKKCIDAVLKQTVNINRIIVVDNNSSDGTGEYLKKSYSDHNIVVFHTLHENIGGAGGFHFGMKLAYNQGFEWIWVMDDDGMPENNCLEQLLVASEDTNALCIAPLVIDIEDDNSNYLSFGLNYPEKNIVVKEKNYFLKNNIKYVFNSANPFNGVLIHKDIFEKIGFPIADMFIWGDETEYLLRIIKNNFKVVTSINAIHKHPLNKKKSKKIFFNKYSIMVSDNANRNYIYFRNYAYINKVYYKKIGLLKYIVLHSYYYIFSKKMDINGLKVFLTAFKHGIKGDFTQNKLYSNE